MLVARQLLSSGHGSFFLHLHHSVFLCSVVVKDFLIIVVSDTAHVWHAAVAYFHVVLVEDMCRLGFMGSAS